MGFKSLLFYGIMALISIGVMANTYAVSMAGQLPGSSTTAKVAKVTEAADKGDMSASDDLTNSIASDDDSMNSNQVNSDDGSGNVDDYDGSGKQDQLSANPASSADSSMGDDDY